jgi:hypothetical protein
MPFYYAKTGVSYSIMWPIRRVEEGEIVTRDFYPKRKKFLFFSHFLASQHNLERLSHLRAWFTDSDDVFDAAYNVYMDKLLHPPKYPEIAVPAKQPLKTHYTVFTDVPNVRQHLTSKHFTVISHSHFFLKISVCRNSR